MPSQDPSQEGGARSSPASPFSRQMRQVGLCLLGGGFLAASVAVSRRSVVRLRTATIPSFYTSNRNPIKVDSADRNLLAVRALGLATLNVMSFGVMLVGGISWAFDLSSVAELRERTRAQLMKPGTYSKEEEEMVQKELESFLDSFYSKLGMERPPTDQEEEETKKAGAEGRNGNGNNSNDNQ